MLRALPLTITSAVEPFKIAHKATCVRDLAWLAERGTIGAGSLRLYLSAINTFLHHTGRNDAPATGSTIIAMKRALQPRELTTIKELRRTPPLPYDVITDLLDDGVASAQTQLACPSIKKIRHWDGWARNFAVIN
eukprot:jgi/Tetstr1/449300/TSEL_003815.t1